MYPDQFGCELEFIIKDNDDKYILTKLKEMYKDQFLYDLKHTSIKADPEQTKVHYKLENSLDSKYGRELTSPICNYDELVKYLHEFSSIITEYATTNELTGLHIHISCSDKTQNEFDLCKFVFLANENNLLQNWGGRNKYCLNIMDIMGYLDLDDVIQFKEHKGRVWNFLKRDTHHVEIRTFGGTDYHNQIDKVIEELIIYKKLFQTSTSTQYSKEYINYLETHAKKLEQLPQDTIEKYLSSFPEIGSFLLGGIEV